MIRHGDPPYLECSSRGDVRFSAMFAHVNGETIEQTYQGAKIFESGTTNLPWRDAKGRHPTNAAFVRKLYSDLWDRYISDNPHLLPTLLAQTGLSDMFGQPGGVCQATELWRIRNEALARTAAAAAAHQDDVTGSGYVILVCGGRDWGHPPTDPDYAASFEALDRANRHQPIRLIVEGGARGADTCARDWAAARRIPFITVPADWDTHGKAAGAIRNQKMLNDHHPDGVISFPGGRGTADMIRRAELARIPIWKPYG